MNDSEKSKLLKAAVEAQKLVPGSVLVGGTATALHTNHRLSYDADYVLENLSNDFDVILEKLEQTKNWKLKRVNKPVLILGSLDNVQIGFRQLRRKVPLETESLDTDFGTLVIPTVPEMLSIKAFLLYYRNATRDYIDFIALSKRLGDSNTITTLLSLDKKYASIQNGSVLLEVSKNLCSPEPYDLDEIDLKTYKNLSHEFANWETISTICVKIGQNLAKKIIIDET